MTEKSRVETWRATEQTDVQDSRAPQWGGLCHLKLASYVVVRAVLT